MKVIGIVPGGLLVSLGATSVPNLLASLGKEDPAYLAGRATVVAAELLLGGLLLYLVIQAPKSSGAEPTSRTISELVGWRSAHRSRLIVILGFFAILLAFVVVALLTNQEP